MRIKGIKRKEQLTEDDKMNNKENIFYTNRELSWLSFNERVLDQAANPNVPTGERLIFANIYQTNLDEFFMVRVGTWMTQMNSSEKILDNKTGMSSEEQVAAILDRTRVLEQKKAFVYEQLMGELEPKGVRIINFNKLSKDEGKVLEQYFDTHVVPFLYFVSKLYSKYEVSEKAREELSNYLEIGMNHIINVDTPLDLSFVSELQDYLSNQPELFYARRSPRNPAGIDLSQSMIKQIEQKDLLLSYPYESMKPYNDFISWKGIYCGTNGT